MIDLTEVRRRIAAFTGKPFRFVPSNYESAWIILQRFRPQRFCELGSGFGVVACMAAMLGHQATGIELDAGLVRESRAIAASYGLEVEFRQEDYRTTDLSAFDLLCVYPWPDEGVWMRPLIRREVERGAKFIVFDGTDFQVHSGGACAS